MNLDKESPPGSLGKSQTNPFVWALKYLIAPFLISNALLWGIIGLVILFGGQEDPDVFVGAAGALFLNVIAGAVYGWLVGSQTMKKVKRSVLHESFQAVQRAERTRRAEALFLAVLFPFLQLGGCSIAMAAVALGQP